MVLFCERLLGDKVPENSTRHIFETNEAILTGRDGIPRTLGAVKIYMLSNRLFFKNFQDSIVNGYMLIGPFVLLNHLSGNHHLRFLQTDLPGILEFQQDGGSPLLT